MSDFFYKINLHLLEPCNYNCKYCFAHFNSKTILTIQSWKKIIDNCIKNDIYPVNYFNLAGGEPLLYPNIDSIIKYIALEKNKKVSIITNGFLLNESFIKNNAKFLDTIGISIDSFNKDILISSGRCTNKQEYLSLDYFLHMYKLIKETNPNCKIKLNTVVSQYNFKDISVFKNIIENKIFIDKIKILKSDLFINESFNNSSLLVSNQEYNYFKRNNLSLIEKGKNKDFFKKIIFEKKISGGYIIIDANGFLVDDTLNNNYTKVDNMLDDKIDFNDSFKNLNFNKDLYYSRYKSL